MARSAASAVTAPGSRASAAARRSPWPNTAWRSERCSTAQVAASAAGCPRSENRSGKGRSRSARLRAHGFGRKPELRRLAIPRPSKLPLVHVPLPRPRHQRRTVPELRILQRRPFIPRRHRRLDLRPPRRKPLHYVPRHPRDLEPAVPMRLLDPVPQILETLGKLSPVDRADRHLVPVEPVIDHGPPLPVLALDHVRHYGMGMELRVQARVRVTARSWAATIRSSPPTSAMRETDLGADSVTSRPGRWWIPRLCPVCPAAGRPALCLPARP